MSATDESRYFGNDKHRLLSPKALSRINPFHLEFSSIHHEGIHTFSKEYEWFMQNEFCIGLQCDVLRIHDTYMYSLVSTVSRMTVRSRLQRRKTTNNLVPVEKGEDWLREMQDIFGDECPMKATIYRWIRRFDNGDEDLNDNPRPGCSTSSKTRSNIERIQTILYEDRRITLRELEERVGI
ncbi:hypothetical protein LOD99_12062 [Oopsacas minuta]|uniref:Mos1 transposase HTH domain-containing protein n=1 Tax=Oopsacas minuta TaxID=111878 RepID=A0AAV7JHA9_9METZ|nr:hypothetical protein LOD99_12062 [Oopsacas minuta]